MHGATLADGQALPLFLICTRVKSGRVLQYGLSHDIEQHTCCHASMCCLVHGPGLFTSIMVRPSPWSARFPDPFTSMALLSSRPFHIPWPIHIRSFEFLEGIVRSAFGRFITTKKCDDASDAVQMLIEQVLLRNVPPEALVDPNDFRRHRMYNEEMDLALREHWDMVQVRASAASSFGDRGVR